MIEDQVNAKHECKEKTLSEHAQDRPAWWTSIRDVENTIGNAV